jgi:hypothetical protein
LVAGTDVSQWLRDAPQQRLGHAAGHGAVHAGTVSAVSAALPQPSSLAVLSASSLRRFRRFLELRAVRLTGTLPDALSCLTGLRFVTSMRPQPHSPSTHIHTSSRHQHSRRRHRHHNHHRRLTTQHTTHAQMPLPTHAVHSHEAPVAR